MSTKKKPERAVEGVVRLDDLDVDESYQRGIKMALAQDIAMNWSDESCGRVLIGRRKVGNRYKLFIIDGQQRVTGAKLIGMETLPAIIVQTESAKEEAALRLQTNLKRNDSSAERFKARLVAEEVDAMAIMAIMRSFKAKLALDHPEADSITAISAIERLYHNDKGVTLRSIFRLLQDADGTIDARNTPTRILWALDWFLDHHDSFDRRRLTTILRQSKAAIRARGDMLSAQMGGSKWVNNYRAIVELYNDGLPKAAQLEAYTRGYRSLVGGRRTEG